MEPQVRWSRPLIGLGLVLSVSILAGCNGAGGGPSLGASSAEPNPTTAAPSEAAASTPGPTDMLVTGINVLPSASFDPKKVAVACDEATLPSGASMSCDDVVALAVRVATTMSKSAVTQVAVTPSPDNPSAIQITFWVPSEEGSGLDAFTSTIDPANQTFTFPTQDTEAVFPTAS